MVEAEFVLDDGSVIERRMVDEDHLFQSYWNNRTLQIGSRKVVIRGCHQISEVALLRLG